MSKTVDLRAADGHALSAYLAEPHAAARGAVVVIQEIFGITDHIRSICEDYAGQGYLVIAPSMFDRLELGVELPYGQDGVSRGAILAKKLDLNAALLDMQAAIDHVAAAAGHVGLVGYCYGGTLAWLAAAQATGLSCVASYYGSHVVNLLDRTPQVPTILHFGARDKMIPLTAVDKIRAAHPQVPVHLYAADHGFNCSERESYNADAATLARERTLALFLEHVAGMSAALAS
jgi:carboxymethylenebutenolidase